MLSFKVATNWVSCSTATPCAIMLRVKSFKSLAALFRRERERAWRIAALT